MEEPKNRINALQQQFSSLESGSKPNQIESYLNLDSFIEDYARNKSSGAFSKHFFEKTGVNLSDAGSSIYKTFLQQVSDHVPIFMNFEDLGLLAMQFNCLASIHVHNMFACIDTYQDESYYSLLSFAEKRLPPKHFAYLQEFFQQMAQQKFKDDRRMFHPSILEHFDFDLNKIDQSDLMGYSPEKNLKQESARLLLSYLNSTFSKELPKSDLAQFDRDQLYDIMKVLEAECCLQNNPDPTTPHFLYYQMVAFTWRRTFFIDPLTQQRVSEVKGCLRLNKIALLIDFFEPDLVTLQECEDPQYVASLIQQKYTLVGAAPFINLQQESGVKQDYVALFVKIGSVKISQILIEDDANVVPQLKQEFDSQRGAFNREKVAYSIREHPLTLGLLLTHNQKEFRQYTCKRTVGALLEKNGKQFVCLTAHIAGHASEKGYIEWFLESVNKFLEQNKLGDVPVLIGVDFNTNMVNGRGREIVENQGFQVAYPNIPTFLMNAYDTFGQTIDGFLVKGLPNHSPDEKIQKLIVEQFESLDIVWILFGKSIRLRDLIQEQQQRKVVSE